MRIMFSVQTEQGDVVYTKDRVTCFNHIGSQLRIVREEPALTETGKATVVRWVETYDHAGRAHEVRQRKADGSRLLYSARIAGMSVPRVRDAE
jgi:hypothetical protein